MPTQPISQAEAMDQRAREVLETVINDDSIQQQLRASLESYRRGEPAKPWEQLQAEVRAGRGE